MSTEMPLPNFGTDATSPSRKCARPDAEHNDQVAGPSSRPDNAHRPTDPRTAARLRDNVPDWAVFDDDVETRGTAPDIPDN